MSIAGVTGAEDVGSKPAGGSFADRFAPAMKNLANAYKDGCHADQAVPASHRLYNAVGMFGAFAAGAHIRDVLRGFDSKNEVIEKDEVIFLLQPLHGLLAYNHYSDEPKDRWMKILCQMIPAVFGATGAIMGSVAYSKKPAPKQEHGREPAMNAIKDRVAKGDAVGGFELDDAASHSQAWPMRVLAGVFATFSAASGLNFFYGVFLNSAFSASNNRQMYGNLNNFGITALNKINNTHGTDQNRTGVAFGNLLNETERYLKTCEQTKITPDEAEIAKFGAKMVERLTPLFPKYTAEQGAELRKNLAGLIEESWQTAAKQKLNDPNKSTAETAAQMIKAKFLDEEKLTGGENFIQTLTELGMGAADIKKASFGNNGMMGKFATSLLPDKLAQSYASAWEKMVDQSLSPKNGGASR
jgi:hypothetical protein